MGFEPTTFTLATCKHRTEVPQNQEVTKGDVNACTAACTNSRHSVTNEVAEVAASGFGEALSMIARLPLSDTEKAEAVRRLIHERDVDISVE